MARRRHKKGGFTLLETLVVLAIVAIALGGVMVSFRAFGRLSAKSAAQHLAAAIRYTYDRSVTTGSYYRLVIDLNSSKYWAESTDDRFYLATEKTLTAGRGKAPDQDAIDKKADEEVAKQQQQLSGLAAQLQPPPQPRRARFQAFKDSALPQVELKGVKIRDIYTPRQTEPYSEGKTYLYFFPDGHTERALIHIEDSDEDVYTLIVHPLTGRVELKSGDVPLERDFDKDAEGHEVAPR